MRSSFQPAQAYSMQPYPLYSILTMQYSIITLWSSLPEPTSVPRILIRIASARKVVNGGGDWMMPTLYSRLTIRDRIGNPITAKCMTLTTMTSLFGMVRHLSSGICWSRLSVLKLQPECAKCSQQWKHCAASLQVRLMTRFMLSIRSISLA